MHPTAALRADEAADGIEECRLARARRAGDRQQGAGRHAQLPDLQCRHRSRTVVIANEQVRNREFRRSDEIGRAHV